MDIHFKCQSTNLLDMCERLLQLLRYVKTVKAQSIKTETGEMRTSEGQVVSSPLETIQPLKHCKGPTNLIGFRCTEFSLNFSLLLAGC